MFIGWRSNTRSPFHEKHNPYTVPCGISARTKEFMILCICSNCWSLQLSLLIFYVLFQNSIPIAGLYGFFVIDFSFLISETRSLSKENSSRSPSKLIQLGGKGVQNIHHKSPQTNDNCLYGNFGKKSLIFIKDQKLRCKWWKSEDWFCL